MSVVRSGVADLLARASARQHASLREPGRGRVCPASVATSLGLTACGRGAVRALRRTDLVYGLSYLANGYAAAVTSHRLSTSTPDQTAPDAPATTRRRKRAEDSLTSRQRSTGSEWPRTP